MKKDKMNCEQYMEQYLALDKGQRVPLSLSVHLLSCRKCREEIRGLVRAEKIASAPVKAPVNLEADSIRRVIDSIDTTYAAKKKNYPMVNWIIAGVVLVGALIVFAVLLNPAKVLSFTLSMIFALLITGWVMAFVATNLDFFVKRVRILRFA